MPSEGSLVLRKLIIPKQYSIYSPHYISPWFKSTSRFNIELMHTDKRTLFSQNIMLQFRTGVSNLRAQRNPYMLRERCSRPITRVLAIGRASPPADVEYQMKRVEVHFLTLELVYITFTDGGVHSFVVRVNKFPKQVISLMFLSKFYFYLFLFFLMYIKIGYLFPLFLTGVVKFISYKKKKKRFCHNVYLYPLIGYLVMNMW